MKKVLFIVIDALSSRIVEPAMQAGKLPVFKQLSELGQFRSNCISIFPSITPAATCSLVTGAYPVDHNIAGAYWYDTQNEEVAYFGADLPAIINEGIDHYLEDFQTRLNAERLKYPTIFEQIEQHGNLTDAVINFMWYKGTVPQRASTPFLMKFIPGATLAESMLGPHQMFLGDFVSTPIGSTTLAARGGVTRRFGFHDEATTDYLLELAKQGPMPDFTLAYFPNNDFDSHAYGPENALSTLQSIDQTLYEFFQVFGGIGEFMKDHVLLLTGDHSQSDLLEDSGVNLEEVLSDYPVVEAGCCWEHEEELKVCPNMRSAQIYMKDEQWQQKEPIIAKLLESSDIDQVIWSDYINGLQDGNDAVFHVATADRGRLSFHLSTPEEGLGVDEHGNWWAWEGELSAVDGKLNDAHEITYDTYPNALERIANGIAETTGNLWLTARLGKEFCLPGLHCNEKGSHGSLHKEDSTAPLFALGLPSDFELTRYPRIVDIAPMALELLNVQPACVSH
ncbi:MAG: alkaline phosphatase family protein [Planctomycetaceae bacterium]